MNGAMGVASAAVLAAAVDELAALIRRPGWVAEEPGVHLTPHLRDAEVAGLSVLDCQAGADGVLDVELEHAGEESRREVRRRIWALIGSVAELSTRVRERQNEDSLVFEIITGIPPRAGGFATSRRTHLRTSRQSLPQCSALSPWPASASRSSGLCGRTNRAGS